MTYINIALSVLMNWCYSFLGSYGLAIIFFTFLTKIVLLPLTLWTYFNSITMIKIQPDVNFLKVKYWGQNDELAEAQAKLFKESGYHPLISTIPLIAQLVLLMGVVAVIREGIETPAISMMFGPVNLGDVPSEHGVSLLWSPVVAGLSALVMCIAQNESNVLQAEQSNWNKYGMLAFSVGLSLYLGYFVPIGVALYWILSNLFSVLQLYATNFFVRPKRFVDYERLEKSREELLELQGVGKQKEDENWRKNKKREKTDYKRFFSVVNKHLVFYSESNGFYKYFRGFIEHILANSKITIHYITSDPYDNIFKVAEENPRIRAYYIGENKLITLMMKMDADMVVMTMPDLENYHIKRSYVRKDIEYVYVMHGIGSVALTLRKGCVDHFDTIFCCGIHQKQDIVETEKIYGLPQKKLLEIGYPLIDEIKEIYNSTGHKENSIKKILIAPSWQKDNIVDSCLEEILDKLKDSDYDIIVRPHPQEVRLKKEYMETLKAKYSSSNIEVQTDFSSNNPIMEADLLITDWSDITYEYAFTTYRPVLFIDTPMKVMNPDWQRIPVEPINIWIREKIGKRLATDNLEKLPETVGYLISHSKEYKENNKALANEYIYNFGNSAQFGAEYIINAIREKVALKKEANNAFVH